LNVRRNVDRAIARSSSVIPAATIVVPTAAEIIERTHAKSLIADIARHLGGNNHTKIGAALVPISRACVSIDARDEVYTCTDTAADREWLMVDR
jgi:hypothetical protein